MRQYESLIELQRHLKKLGSNIETELDNLKKFTDFFQVATTILAGRIIDFGKPTITKKKSILDKSKLLKHFSTLKYLLSREEELNNILYALKTSFKNEGLPAERAIKETLKIKDRVSKGIEESTEILEKIATKQAPPKFQSMVDSLAKDIKNNVKAKAIEVSYNIGLNPEGTNFQVAGYIHFHKLVGEDTFIHNDYYLIIVYDTSENGYFVIVSKDYKLPGGLKGSSIIYTYKALLKEALDSLNLEGNLEAFDTRKPPLEKEELKSFNSKLIKKVDIKDNRIIFTIHGVFRDDEIIRDLFSFLMGLVRKAHPRTRHRLKYKFTRKGKKDAILEFVFVIEDREGKLSNTDLNNLVEKFNLTQKQAAQIEAIIEGKGD